MQVNIENYLPASDINHGFSSGYIHSMSMH